LGERLEQVLAHVVGERFERRNVEDLRLVAQSRALSNHAIETAEKRRERLARPGGRCNQGIFARPDARPPEGLRLGGRPELPFEPRRHRRMKSLEHRSHVITERPFRSTAKHAMHAKGWFSKKNKKTWRAWRLI